MQITPEVERSFKGARIPVLMFFAGASVLALSLAYGYLELNRVNARIKDADKELTGKQLAAANLEQKIKDLNINFNVLNTAFTTTGGENSDCARRQEAALNQAIDTTPGAAAISPRVYIHICSESQRPIANALAVQLQQGAFLVPGTQLVGRQSCPRITEVRYFRDTPQEKQDVDLITRIIVTAGKAPVPKFLSGYENSPNRPRHYEIWFGATAP